MAPDEFQKAWQGNASHNEVKIDAELLQKEFQSVIFWRDFREVTVALVLLPVWFFMGATMGLPWSWYLVVPGLVWVAGFMLVYRARHKREPAVSDAPLVECLTQSLAEQEDQIWLLRNVLWWYLLPIGIPILIFIAHVSGQKAKDWQDAIFDVNSLIVVSIFALYYYIYWLNQRCVRKQLEPRRQELQELLVKLGGDPEQAASDRVRKPLGPYFLVGGICGLILLAVVMLGLYGGKSEAEPALPDTAQATEGGAHANSPNVSDETTGETARDPFQQLVIQQREQGELVGLGALVWADDEVVAVAVDGERKVRSGKLIETGDSWHVGGITKSITATMIARLIEAGEMDWNDTLSEVFSEGLVDEAWREVTVRQLLLDTAGAPANFPKSVYKLRPKLGPESTVLRRDAVFDVISKKPAYPVGEKRVYSNVGVSIAAAMAEEVTGLGWEELVSREVFEPLRLTTAGFGPPQSFDALVVQPVGHVFVAKRKFGVPSEADNSMIMAPSGAVHMSLEDLSRYAVEHMRGESGQGTLLSAETYILLHMPDKDGYACGWMKREATERLPHTVYWHNGSNKMWYGMVAFVPDLNRVVVVAANDGDIEKAEPAAWAILRASLESD